MEICRLCGRKMVLSPILALHNMPRSAQGFLEINQLHEDKGEDVLLYQCKYCGLIQLLCKPVGYYKDVIRASGISQEMKEFRRKQFSRFVENYDLKNKKIIEIGAGCGEYMEVMKEVVGDTVYGIEHKSSSVEICIQKGLQVSKAYPEIENAFFQNGPFHAFYIMNFLEHVPNPRQFLEIISNNLYEDAVGIVEVPNLDMILKENLYSELICDHLVYYTRETLTKMMEYNGFEVISCKSIWYDYILSAEIRKRKEISLDSFYTQKDQMKKEMQTFLAKKAPLGKIAVWGAGHQALANLMLLGMTKYVHCILDSAVFKQNKYTPASHLPIFSPDELKKGEIKTVIVMAGGYSDEIVRIIHNQYTNVPNIAIVRGNKLEILGES